MQNDSSYRWSLLLSHLSSLSFLSVWHCGEAVCLFWRCSLLRSRYTVSLVLWIPSRLPVWKPRRDWVAALFSWYFWVCRCIFSSGCWWYIIMWSAFAAWSCTTNRVRFVLYPSSPRQAGCFLLHLCFAWSQAHRSGCGIGWWAYRLFRNVRCRKASDGFGGNGKWTDQGYGFPMRCNWRKKYLSYRRSPIPVRQVSGVALCRFCLRWQSCIHRYSLRL